MFRALLFSICSVLTAGLQGSNCTQPNLHCIGQEAERPSYTLVRRASTCWSSTPGDRIDGPVGGSIESCARWVRHTAGCSAHFEVDHGGNNWCGCGRAESPNGECNLGGFHSASNIYRLASPEELDELEAEKSVVTIPMSKQSVEVVRNGKTIAHKTAHFASIFMGFPVSQEFKVVFDTGSGHLFVPSNACEGYSCTLHQRYDRSASGSAQDIAWNGDPLNGKKKDRVAIQYGTGNVEGDFVSEVACLGSAPPQGLDDTQQLPAHCTRLRLVMATTMSDQPFQQFEFDGVLGLGLQALAVKEEFHFLTQMMNSEGPQKVLPIFSVFFAKGGKDSEISFGGHNENRMAGPMHWAQVEKAEVGHWHIKVFGVKIGGQVFDDCADSSCSVIVDTGTSVMGVPKSSVKAFHKAAIHEAPDKSANCWDLVGPNLEFDMGGFSIELKSQDFIRGSPKEIPANHATGAKPGSYCYPHVLPVVLQELGPKVFIFGEPVFLRYYTSYDAGNKLIGFAPAAAARPEITV